LSTLTCEKMLIRGLVFLHEMTCDEDGLVLVKQALELVEVDSFGSGFAPHDSLGMKLGYLRAN